VRTLDDDLEDNWLHSDFKNIAYPYVYKVFDKFVGIGGLKE